MQFTLNKAVPAYQHIPLARPLSTQKKKINVNKGLEQHSALAAITSRA